MSCVEVAQHQRLGERALVLEVIEEAALGDAGRRDQLLDRGGGEALRHDRGFRQRQQAFFRLVGALGRLLEHGQLYHESS